MAMPVVWPSGLLTVREWDALPDTEVKVELVEGVVTMAARPVSAHQRAVFRLCAQLDAQLPDGLEAMIECEVLLVGDPLPTVRVPDVIVVPTGPSRSRFDAADVLIAVEVISPGTRNVDRWLKRNEYAEARIPAYWLIDLDRPDGPQVTIFERVSGDDEPSGRVTAGAFSADTPVPLHVDLTALTGPRQPPA